MRNTYLFYFSFFLVVILVFIEDTASLHFTEAYSRLSGHRVFTFSTLNLDPNLLKDNKERILMFIPKSHRNKIRRFINETLKNWDKIKAFVELRDEFGRKVVYSFVENNLFDGVDFEVYEGDRKVEKVPKDIDLLKLSEYTPVSAVYRSGRTVKHGYIFLPSEKELQKVSLKGVLPTGVLEGLVLRNSSVVIDERKVIIGSRVYRFDEANFIRVLPIIGRFREARDIVLGKILLRIPDNMRGMVRTDTTFLPEVSIKGKMGELGMNVPPEFEDIPVTIKVSGDLNSYPNVVVAMQTDEEILMKISVRANIDEIPEKIGKIIKKVEEVLNKHGNNILSVLRAGKREKFDVYVSIDTVYINVSGVYTNINSDGMPELKVSYSLYKGNDRIILEPARGNLKGWIEVNVDVGRRDISEDFVFQRLLNRGVNLYRNSVSKWGRKLSVKKEIDNMSIDDILFEYKELKAGVKEAIREYDEIKKGIKSKVGKVSTEQLVALYLVEYVTYSDIKTDLLIGRNKSFMYSRIGKLAKQLDPEEYEELKRYYSEERRGVVVDGRHNIIDILLDNGYVKVNPEGIVEINGKSIIELLKRINPNWSEVEIYNLNDSIASTLLDRKLGYPSKEKLEKHGLLTPNIVSLLIRKHYTQLDPEILAEEFNGKPIWNQLPSDVKRMYVEGKANSESLYKMLTTYRDVFKDMENEIILRLVNLDWNRGTKYLAEYKPDLISNKDKLEVFTEGTFAGIKLGEFTVQVAVMNTLSKYSEKTFIVYGVNDKVGMPVTGKTVEEVYKKGKKMYGDFIKEFKRLKEISANDNYVKLWDDFNYEGYKVYTVMVGPVMYRSEYLVAPGVLKKVNKKLREIEEEMRKEREKRKKRELLLN